MATSSTCLVVQMVGYKIFISKEKAIYIIKAVCIQAVLHGTHTLVVSINRHQTLL